MGKHLINTGRNVTASSFSIKTMLVTLFAILKSFS